MLPYCTWYLSMGLYPAAFSPLSDSTTDYIFFQRYVIYWRNHSWKFSGLYNGVWHSQTFVSNVYENILLGALLDT